MTAYDKILYPSYSHPQTHPDNLAVVGSLFGLRPAAITKCRVLELGCGNGTNLIPMAWGLPESEFVGIDLAEVPVKAGQQMAADLAVRNVRLVAGDVMEIDSSWGAFDYIIAHGFYSWVPAAVRDRVMNICQKHLTPGGIAFISYNAYPGCHLRQMLREMMLFHVREIGAPEERLRQGRALLSFLHEAHVNKQDEYATWLHKEFERANAMDESHLFHDDLAPINEPFYFYQFMAHAAGRGLQYLGEADFFEMSDHVFAPTIREVLKGTAHDRLLREQYLDFLKCRRFRQTLLCREDARIGTEPVADSISGFHISSKAKRDDSTKGGKPSFRTAKGARVETDFAPGLEALELLAEEAPNAIRFDELVRRIGVEEASGQELQKFLLQLYSAGVVEFKTHSPAKARTPGEYPKASPVAQWQVERGDTVTSLDHQLLEVGDEVGKFLLQKLDGTRNREQLTGELIQFLKSRGTVGEGSDEQVRERVEQELEENLRKIARLGLLLA